jgi:hypothetical protein
MSDPLIEPVRRPRLAPFLWIGLIAFLAGAAVVALIGWRSGRFARTPVPATATAPSQTTAPALAAIAPPTLDALAARELALANQLQALQAQVTAVTPQAALASGYAGRAEALLVAFAGRRAIDAGRPLGAVEPRLYAQFNALAPRDVATIVAAARNPVTLDDLRARLDAAAPDLVSGIGVGGWSESLAREIGSLVVIRRADQPPQRPAAQLDHARALLTAGQVDAALAEVIRLPGAAAAQDWTARARRYVEAHNALDRIEALALQLPVAQQQQPAPTPAPAAR